MAYLDQHPPHVRRSIALVVTIVVAVILLGVLVFTYTHKRDSTDREQSPLADFYTTILHPGQSSSEPK